MHWLLDYLLQCQAEPAGLECAPWGPWLGLTLWTSGPPVEPSQALPELSPPIVSSAPISHEGSLGSLGVLLAVAFCQAQGGRPNVLDFCSGESHYFVAANGA